MDEILNMILKETAGTINEWCSIQNFKYKHEEHMQAGKQREVAEKVCRKSAEHRR